MRRGMFLCSCIWLAGCTVGPDFTPPALPASGSYTRDTLATGDDQHFTSDADIPADWWTVYHSPALDRLVRQALAKNPGLDAAQAAVRVAMENVKAQSSALYPSVTAG